MINVKTLFNPVPVRFEILVEKRMLQKFKIIIRILTLANITWTYYENRTSKLCTFNIVWITLGYFKAKCTRKFDNIVKMMKLNMISIFLVFLSKVYGRIK
jgi:hypothetical protein